MAIGDNYITMQELKDYMSIQGAAYDARITSVVSAVSREVESWCNRQFNLASAPSARVYDLTDIDTVIVDDFSTTAGLIVQSDINDDGLYYQTWTAGDYTLRPLNGVRNGSTGSQLRFKNTRRPHVKVTAQWGWTSVPDPVHEACLMLGADTFQLKDSRLGIAGSDQFGTVVRVRDSVVVQSRLKHYVRGSVYVK